MHHAVYLKHDENDLKKDDNLHNDDDLLKEDYLKKEKDLKIKATYLLQLQINVIWFGGGNLSGRVFIAGLKDL